MVESDQAVMTFFALSDTHFGIPGRHGSNEKKADAIAHRLMTLPPRIELVTIGGDITHTGSVYETEQAAEALRVSPVHVIAILGNHDYPQNDRRQVAKALGRAGIELLLDGEIYTHENERATVSFGGVTGFSHDYNARIMGPGNMTDAEFTELVKKDRKDARTTIRRMRGNRNVLIVHFPVLRKRYPESNEDEVQLRTPAGNGDFRGEIFKNRHRLNLILHGHVHSDPTPEVDWDGVPIVNVAPLQIPTITTKVGLPGIEVHV